jgi:hypothetical protein
MATGRGRMKNTEYRFKQILLLAEALESEIKLTNKKFVEDFAKMGTNREFIAFALLQVNGTMLEEALVTIFCTLSRLIFSYQVAFTTLIKLYPGQPILEKFLEDFLRNLYKKVEL